MNRQSVTAITTLLALGTLPAALRNTTFAQMRNSGEGRFTPASEIGLTSSEARYNNGLNECNLISEMRWIDWINGQITQAENFNAQSREAEQKYAELLIISKIYDQLAVSADTQLSSHPRIRQLREVLSDLQRISQIRFVKIAGGEAKSQDMSEMENKIDITLPPSQMFSQYIEKGLAPPLIEYLRKDNTDRYLALREVNGHLPYLRELADAYRDLAQVDLHAHRISIALDALLMRINIMLSPIELPTEHLARMNGVRSAFEELKSVLSMAVGDGAAK